jgi:hypothetical protein
MSLAASFVSLRANVVARPWTFVIYGTILFLLARRTEQGYAEKGAPWPGLLLLASARWIGLVFFFLLVVHALIADACARLWCSLLFMVHALLHGACLEIAATDHGVRIGIVRRVQPPAQVPASDEARTAS